MCSVQSWSARLLWRHVRNRMRTEPVFLWGAFHLKHLVLSCRGYRKVLFSCGERFRVMKRQAVVEAPSSKRGCDFTLLRTSIRKNVRSFILETEGVDAYLLFDLLHDRLVELLQREVENGSIKFNIVLKVDMKKPRGEYWIHADPIPRFSSKYSVVLNSAGNSLDDAYGEIHQSMENNVKNGSGWIVHHIDAIYVNVVKYQPLKGSSYIDIPGYLKNKKSHRQCEKYGQFSSRKKEKKQKKERKREKGNKKIVQTLRSPRTKPYICKVAVGSARYQ